MSSAGGDEGDGGMPRRRLCVCTRIHQNNANRPVDLVKVREFVDAALQYAEGVAIAVGPTPPSTDHRDGASDAGHSGDGQAHRPDSLLHAVSRVAREATEAHASSWHGGRYGDEEGGGRGAGKSGALVNVFMVTPWGKFVPALNALLGFAARNGADFVMFQSLETSVGIDAVLEMEKHMGPGDLVVGAALTGHAFDGGAIVELTGVTTPWNTLALWDVAKIAKLGFLGVAEGLLPGVAAGIEEVTAIATLQALLGEEHARAKLLRLPQVQWQTNWEDEGRRQWHESKMASKVERAEKQMVALGVKRGVVHHLA